MVSTKKTKPIHIPVSFEMAAHAFVHKEGLCIFELNNQWRIISWWNGRETTTDIPSSNFRVPVHEVPFSGGWVGWIQYPDPKIEAFFWKTDGSIAYHIPTQTYTIVGTSDFCREANLGLNKHPSSVPSKKSVLVPNSTLADKSWFCDQVTTLRRAIYEGMVYQANLSRRSKAFAISQPLYHYLHIQKNNPARCGGYLQFGHTQVISNSPELFLNSSGQDPVILHSQPIKGTTKLGQREFLWNNKKEKSELTMIADLMRNDFGRIAKTGSIFTNSRSLRRCGDLLHAQQSIYAHVQPETTVSQILEATFPAGSITGAPKKSAMKYISELERHPRKLYTGAIGWISSPKHCHFNVAIRTLFIEHTHTHLHVGCGIVYNSQPEKEWEESISKGNALSKLLFT